MTALLLIRPLVRAVDWQPIAVVAALSATLAVVLQPGDGLLPHHGVLLLRMAALLAGAAAAFILVDAMALSTEAVPVPRWLRQWLRTVMAVMAAAAVWGIMCAIVIGHLPADSPDLLSGAAVEATLCVLIALAGTASAVRHTQGKQAALAGAVVLLLFYVVAQIFADNALPWPTHPDWDRVHLWWLRALPLPLLVIGLAHRDVR
ncbi:unnamed protein product [[Actinomadura] parvosata subsp. kistnae]|uniref:hypothetical protein n=1 Tax=[Actinomadura] parvosata TaxID=1955412 RepID=UPI000D26ED2B|nr:unnamed protein product [Actinomadura parvosata subsp. kistnae]